MTTLHQRIGRQRNGKRPSEGSPSEREGLRFAKYQRAKVHQEIREERRAARQGWRLDDARPLPFGSLGRPQYETFDDPTGLQLPLAAESPEDALIQEIEDDVVHIWRNSALLFGLLTVAMGTIRTAVDLLDVEWLELWFLDAATVAFALAASTSALTAYLVRTVSNEVRDRHQIERARINAVAAERSQQQPGREIVGTRTRSRPSDK